MNQQNITERAAKAGFTLIEIIIAISIVGIMAAVAVPNINKYLKNARINAARQLIDTAKNATIQYQNEHKGKVPDTQDAWVEGLTGGEEPYIEGGPDALTDPWGEPLRYEKKGKGGRFNIYSNGPDGEQGGDDDLSAFEDKR